MPETKYRGPGRGIFYRAVYNQAMLDSRASQFEFHSQLGQDLWAMQQSDFKQNGYFIEIGAADGVELSNTYALEKYLGWSGICVEPTQAIEQLMKNRDCIAENRCVWARSGEKMEFLSRGLYGGIVPEEYRGQFDPKEIHMKETISLEDVLKEHNAPSYIDYMSIDTEGTELDIISSFDFNSYHIALMTIEHNGRRQEIAGYLRRYGYTMFDHLDFTRNYYREVVFNGMTPLGKEHYPNSVGGGDYDDWYIKSA